MLLSTRRARWAVCLFGAAVLITTAGCDPVDAGPVADGASSTTSAKASAQAPNTAAPTSKTPNTMSGCGAARGRTAALLPRPAGDIRAVKQGTNPCVPLADLAGQVLDLFGDTDREEPRIDKKAFRYQFSTVAGYVLTANDVVGCAYETDNLAVQIYQQRGHAWSAGVAAVIRGNLDAALEVTVCYFRKQVEFAPPTTAPDDPGPDWDPCVDVAQPTHNGEVYTVLIAGTSDEMCTFLRKAL